MDMGLSVMLMSEARDEGRCVLRPSISYHKYVLAVLTIIYITEPTQHNAMSCCTTSLPTSAL